MRTTTVLGVEMGAVVSEHTEHTEKANPYASPVIPDSPGKPLLPQDKWHLLKLHVADVQMSRMRRRIVLAGDIDSEVFFDGWAPITQVTVNGGKRFRHLLYFSIVCPIITMELESSDFRVPGFVESKATLSLTTLFRLTEFRLFVAGRLIYSDG